MYIYEGNEKKQLTKGDLKENYTSLSTGGIIGVVIGLILLIILGYFIFTRYVSRSEKFDNSQNYFINDRSSQYERPNFNY